MKTKTRCVDCGAINPRFKSPCAATGDLHSKPQSGPDFTVDGDLDSRQPATVYLLRPHTIRAWEWTEEHLPDATRFGNAVVVEHRYILDIAAAIEGDGLTVR